MNRMRADQTTVKLVRRVLTRSKQRGADPVRALDDEGLLSYPSRTRVLNQLLLANLADMIETMTPTQLGNGTIPATAMDMKRCIVEHIQRLSRKESDG